MKTPVIAPIALLVLAGAAAGQTTAGTPSVNRDQIRAIVAEAMADAETRSSLLDGGATAGHDGKFFIASSDGGFRLNIGGDIQVRYVVNYRGDDNTVTAPNKGDDFDTGFQNSRIRLHFGGNIINKDWTYRILTRSSSAGEVIVEEAYGGHNFGNGWKAVFGQFKVPLLHEELVSSVKQLAVERSLVNGAYSQSRSQGVQLGYEQEDWNAKVAFSDGLLSENTDFTNQVLISSAAGAPFIVRGEADYAFTGRFEFKFAGAWDQYQDFTSKPSESAMAVAGVAAHFQQSPNTGDGTDVDRQTLEYTADFAFEQAGWNFYGAFVGRHEEFRGAGAANQTDFDDFGGLAQGGYRWSSGGSWGDQEVFARWDALFPDSDRNLNNDAYNFVTLGFNDYFAGHAAKFTFNAIIALNETNDIANVAEATPGAGSIRVLPSTGSGLLGSSESGEVAFQMQMQLLF